MTDLSTPEKIKEALHQALDKVGKFEQCALLDYPDNRNVGDQLIWLGNIFYLTDVLKTKINYATNIADFSEVEMEKQVGKAPIFLHGGGNFGDLWIRHQKFREEIITKYQDRPIVILPQTIYFSNQDNLHKTADILNTHPNLTLLARDNYSYELAVQHFYNCQVLKAPDTAFQMVNMPGLSFSPNQNQSILYQRRGDKELNTSSSPDSINLPNLVVKDWVAFKQKVVADDWISYSYQSASRSWSIRDRARLIREVLRESREQGSLIPDEWISRQSWQHFHPYAAKFDLLYNPSMHRRSWGFMHSGMYQLKQHRLVITSRLHGHIFCILLGIPHVFLANSYHKNQMFYESWTSQIPFCRFVKDASKIEATAQELLELFPGQ